MEEGATYTQTQKTGNDSVEPKHSSKMLYCRIFTYNYLWTRNISTKLCLTFRRHNIPRTLWWGYVIYEIHSKNLI